MICAGLPRSASTWIYNATRLLLKSRGKVAGISSNGIPADLRSYARTNACLLVKAHEPDDALVGLAQMLDAPIIVSVRDPRDALVSFEISLGVSRADALGQLKGSAAALLKLDDYPQKLLLKYEETSDRVACLTEIANHIGVQPSAELLHEIAEELDLETVKKDIARLEAEGVLDSARPAEVWTEDSLWHPNHCGDGASGKLREKLSPFDAAIVGNQLRAFFDRFGYAADDPPRLPIHAELQFSGDGLAYAREGFSASEDWGAWTEGDQARIVLPLTGRASRYRLTLKLARGPALAADRGGSGELRVNGETFPLFEDRLTPDEFAFAYEGDLATDRIEIELAFKGLRSPQQLGLGPDNRRLGVGVMSLALDYE